jgi:small conductance mechanosensitive channel
MDVSGTMQVITAYAVGIGFKIVGAIIFWLIGRWLIAFAVRMVTGSLERQKVEPTLLRYLGTIISVTLNVILVVAILGYFGVETTSFAAIVAAAGIAIGMAWSGLLSNFAAGAFIMVLRPFKVGDFVTVGGITGTVKEIGLFVTAINTPDNVLTMLGNNKIFSDTIQNFSVNPYRRVDLKAQLAHSVDHNAAIKLLKESVSKVPNVLPNPAPDVEILEFNFNGPVLAVRFVRTATPIITGKFILTPTKSFVKALAPPDIQCRSSTSSFEIRRKQLQTAAKIRRGLSRRGARSS